MKLKVLVVAHRVCSRTTKQLIALSDKVDIHLITARIPLADIFKTVTFYQTSLGLREALKRFHDVDIIHAVSEPSWVVIACRELLSEKKIVLDWHDAQWWRSGDPIDASTEERLVGSWVDGVIVPSDACREIFTKMSDTPCLVLPPYCNEQSIAYQSWGYIGGIVYEGRVDLPSARKYMNYCKYVELCNAFLKADISFNIYSPYSEYPEHKKVYSPICAWNQGREHNHLISLLGVYDWGLCGNIGKHREWDITMPNKLFEYMSAGIPIIALNSKQPGDFIEEHGMGISVNSIEEIKERWDERDKCQKNVMLKRHQFTMEKHIGTVTDFYRKILSES